MDKFDIQKLRDLPIEGVAERLGLRVQKHKALCPFHEDSHPSLTFNVSRNTFKCYVCDAHGGVIDLAMKMLNKPFLETCQWLANEHNVILTEWQPVHKPSTLNHKPSLDLGFLSDLVRQPVLNAEAREFLFEKRHYNAAVIRWLGISSISFPTPCWRYGRPYYDAPSLLIPYRDVDGNLMSVQSRYLGPKVESGGMRDEGKSLNPKPSTLNPPRFRFPRGGKCGIFNLPILRILKPGEPLFISEGVTDCMALLSAGHKAIAIPSATLLSREDKKLLKEFVQGNIEGTFYWEEVHKAHSLNPQPSTLNLHMYPDADIPGEKLYIELLHVANQIGACLTRHSLPEGCKDFSDYYIKIQTS